MLKSSFNEHALANTRSVACDVEPTADTLTQPNRYFATLRSFSSALWSNVNEIGLRLGYLMHFLIVPKTPRSRPRRRDTIDEVNQADGNYRKNRLSMASTVQMCLPYVGVEKERRCGVALSGLT
jgi:hypothetical protein